jgi:serine/threonine-protein kinase HipA
MTEIQHVESLRVELDLEGKRRNVGRLAWSRKDRAAYFQFDPEFMASPLPISPFTLPVKSGVHEGEQAFEGLHGVFNDSLPDGWGRRLFDRHLKSLGYDERLVTPLDRLASVGGRSMGAFRYVPEKPLELAKDEAVDLDWLSDEARRVEKDEPDVDITKLREAQGGSAGARPKIVVGMNPGTGALRLDHGQELPQGFEHWLIKFRANDDPKEIGAEEYAYALMAGAAGVSMPGVRLLRTKSEGYFAVRRFDRSDAGRHHVHTVSGLINVSHRDAGAIDYGVLMKVTAKLTKNAIHVEQMFVRMVFNALVHNRDDHAKNHAFMMDANGVWSPSPAYDITFSNGPGGEHNLAIAGEGRNPSLEHFLQVAKEASITDAKAREINDRVRATVNRWPDYAEQAGLSKRRADEIDTVINGRRPTPKRKKRADEEPETQIASSWSP